MDTAKAAAEACWTEEWKRTKPDRIVYLPKTEEGADADNEHFLVFEAPYDGHLLAVWTQAEAEGGHMQRIVLARSVDGGITWGQQEEIAGPQDGDGKIASWGFPVVSRSGRIYCFWTKFVGIIDNHRQMTGWMQCAYSDDNGYTWIEGGYIPFKRTAKDYPDPSMPPNWIVWQLPIRDSQGRPLVGFTRHSSIRARGETVLDGWGAQDSRCEFIRFDNIDEGPHPNELRLTWLPEGDGGLQAPLPGKPGYSFAQEPSLVLLPDQRLFCVFRTLTGRIWYSVSGDDGRTWRMPEVLRYEDGGEEILQPVAPCPVYSLQDGRFLLLFHNNDGTAGGGTWPGDSNLNRQSAYIAVGEYRELAHQPIWFSRPKLLCTSGGVAVGSSMNGDQQIGKAFRIEVATYTSLTEFNGSRILWYPDRKHFLLGRIITDEWLEGLQVSRKPSLYAPLLSRPGT
ncbi:MAG: BNR/Asp-box repeat protein [Paenibacillaceae bacterium]|jgi:hypothetical protein|nr:BNR/Asp-box repeat protein [Paenibacillaceae bacterium]